MNLIHPFRIQRWFYTKNLILISKAVQLLIFLLYNSKITGDTEIGKGTYFVCKGICTVLVPGTIIGENCVIGLRFSTVRKFPFSKVPLIGNNVWFGPNVVIAGPVIIEDNVVVGANSFVNKSIPKGAIVAGNPAKIIGWRKDLDYDLNDNPKFKKGIAEFL